MKSWPGRFALIATLSAALCVSAMAAQKGVNAITNPPASPQAKTSQPATHFTQGAITSIDANQVVLNQRVRGKAKQVTFMLNPATQRSGNLAVGTRVTVQYREDNNQKIASAVREFTAKSTGAAKSGSKPGSKS